MIHILLPEKWNMQFRALYVKLAASCPAALHSPVSFGTQIMARRAVTEPIAISKTR
jgi:hypothetical protein